MVITYCGPGKSARRGIPHSPKPGVPGFPQSVPVQNLGRFRVNQRLIEKSNHLANEITTLVALELLKYFGQVKIIVGHRSFPFVSSRTHKEILRWPVFSKRPRNYTTSGDVNW